MAINYPDRFDDDSNLYLVRDAVRLTLVEDYLPGDTTLQLDGDPNAWVVLPATGILTLTDQCSDLRDRAISFEYTKVASESGTMSVTVALLPGFADVPKPKGRTHATLNVMAAHHNQIKDALVAIEEFIGVQGTIDVLPLGPTMVGRINFLRKLVLSPRAYFVSDRKLGLVPMTVTFTDLSFRLGSDGTTGEIVYQWDFGDGTTSNISATISDPPDLSNVLVDCAHSGLVETNLLGNPQGTKVQKTYCEPGIYDVSLTVTNKFGSDQITIPALVHARVEAPAAAHIEFIADASSQLVIGDTIRTPVGTLVTIQVPLGEDPDRPGFSYAGERLTTGGIPIDPAITYTWRLDDDLSHDTSSPVTRGAYSLGGRYDVRLRIDTEYGAYRITSLPDSIDVVERTNLWFFLMGGSTLVAQPYEFGLISETFKVAPMTYTVARDESFLTGKPNEPQQKREFRRAGFTPIGTTPSGNQGTALLFYATGRSPAASRLTERISFAAYSGFAQTFTQGINPISRPWNWANFNSPTNAYFLLGSPTAPPEAFASPTNLTLTDVNMGTQVPSETTWNASNFHSGSDDLMINAGYVGGSNFNTDGTTKYGDFSTYRTAWKDSTGFLLRNATAGDFFRIRSFYGTEGTIGDPVANITRLQDMPGPAKLEGELLPLSTGLYFFNNSGAISAYNNISQTWETGGPGVNSPSFRSLQDQGLSGYDSPSNTLKAASDGDKRAYLSYDYSPAAFTKFNAVDLTFSALPSRPLGTQLAVGIY